MEGVETSVRRYRTTRRHISDHRIVYIHTGENFESQLIVTLRVASSGNLLVHKKVMKEVIPIAGKSSVSRGVCQPNVLIGNPFGLVNIFRPPKCE